MNRSTFKLMQLACMDYDHLAKHILRNKLPSPSSLDKVFLIHFYLMYELAHLKFLVSGFHAFVNVKMKKSVCSGTGSSLCVCVLCFVVEILTSYSVALVWCSAVQRSKEMFYPFLHNSKTAIASKCTARFSSATSIIQGCCCTCNSV